jgi:hypothetical protein
MSVQVQIGADVTQFDAVVATLPDKVARSSQQMTRANGGLMRSLGGVSMQVQDIAVQLQMGTQASTVLAQQGSQLLSAFGAGGAIAGGVIAIGGAFLAMADNSRRAFNEAARGHDDLMSRFQRGFLGGAGDVAEQTAIVTQQVDKLASKIRDIWADRSAADVIAETFGGPSFDDKVNQMAYQQEDLETLQKRADNEIIARGAQELQIIKAQIAGEKEKAAILQHQLNLMREEEKINASAASPAAKNVMMNLARARSDLAFNQLNLQGATPTGPNLLGRVTGFFGAAMTQMAPTIDAISNRLKERAQQSLSRTQAFAGALGGLRGDMDTSTGRSAFNPLRADGSKQLSEMARQTAALRRVAQTGDKQTSLLQSIDATIRRLNLIPKYS